MRAEHKPVGRSAKLQMLGPAPSFALVRELYVFGKFFIAHELQAAYTFSPMTPKSKRQKEKTHDISLRDVVNHMSAMEQRLSGRIDSNTKGIEANTRGIEENRKAIVANTAAIQDVKITLTECIDGLDEDLSATIMDTIKIRGHVGMPIPTDS